MDIVNQSQYEQGMEPCCGGASRSMYPFRCVDCRTSR